MCDIGLRMKTCWSHICDIGLTQMVVASQIYDIGPVRVNNLPECLLLLFVQFVCTKQEKTLDTLQWHSFQNVLPYLILISTHQHLILTPLIFKQKCSYYTAKNC